MTNKKNEEVKINLKLEQIEESVKLCIKDVNYDRVLLLITHFVHRIQELFVGK